jgi:hypothetical protein
MSDDIELSYIAYCKLSSLMEREIIQKIEFGVKPARQTVGKPELLTKNLRSIPPDVWRACPQVR